jgi:hypothetical protein
MTVPNKKVFSPLPLLYLSQETKAHEPHNLQVIYIKFHYDTMNRKDIFSTKTSWVYTTKKEEDMGR